jgi:organic radical activating enzyme
MSPKDYLTNKNFCPIPWTGLMYNFDGSIKNCIRSAESIGNIKNNSIHEILNGKANITTKRDMLDNQPGSRCHPCYKLEQNKKSLDIISDRVFYLRELKSVPLTTYQHVENFDLHTIDVRWSNLCNFACVYCYPEFSSKWESELGLKIETPMDHNRTEFANYIYDNIKKLKHVYLAGGEPLLIKENYNLLQALQKENPDVKLRINTNLSKVDTRIFELVCSFKNVHWTVSVESIEEEYEYIRYGGRWLDFVDNLKVIQKLDHRISFNMLHFLLNYQSIFKCVDYLTDMGFHNNSFVIGALLEPDYLNIRNLPDNMLNLVKDELLLRINKQPGFLIEDGYRNVLDYINQPYEKKLLNSFNLLKEMDSRRNLDSTKIFKELYKENYHGKTI